MDSCSARQSDEQGQFTMLAEPEASDECCHGVWARPLCCPEPGVLPEAQQ